MKNIIAVTMAAVFVLSLGVAAVADEYGPAKSSTTTAGKPSVTKSMLIQATATVQAIDLAKRKVTLKGEGGEIFDITVGKEVKNLPQVKVGDLVVVKYYESIAVNVMKAGEAPKGTSTMAMGKRAKPGQMPSGMIGKQVTVTANVTAIDQKKQEVTLKGPEGKTVQVHVKDPKNLKNVQVGDDVVITYTEALAISVEKAKK
jgi:Cu/Ag efflux protein CusF